MLIGRIKTAICEIFLQLAIYNVRWSGRFDDEQYLKANDDVARQNFDPIRHYLLHGKAESRLLFPNGQMSGREQSVSRQGIEKLVFVWLYRGLTLLMESRFNPRYLRNSARIRASGLFDEQYYFQNNKDVMQSGMDPVLHYVVFGCKEGRNPSPEFDTTAYALRARISPDSNINPLIHYIEHVDAMGKSPSLSVGRNYADNSIRFDSESYLRKYADLVDLEAEPHHHFRSHGIYEGRDSGTAESEYSEWRRSFVLRPCVPKLKEPVKLPDPRITVCLIYEGQRKEQIERTFEFLRHKESPFDLAVLTCGPDRQSSSDSFLKKISSARHGIRVARTPDELVKHSDQGTDFFCFLRIGDQLLTGSIRLLKHVILTRPNLHLVYSDEETVDTGALLIRPSFKGGYDPDLELENDYVGNLVAVSKDALAGLGTFETETWQATRYLMLNRLFSRLGSDSVYHIPNILYRRIGSVKWGRDVPRALASQVEKTSVGGVASVEPREQSGQITFRALFSLPESGARASIIIPTRNGINLLKACIDSILEKSAHRNFEIIIIDNGSDEPATLQYLESLQNTPSDIRVIRHDHPFNYSELNNLGAAAATGDFLVFLNNDVEVISSDWLDELLAQAARPEIGIVGPLLLYEDGTVQSAGVALGVGGVASNAFSGWDPNSSEFAPYRHTRRVSAVTGACLVVQRPVFEAVGGFDETNLPVDFNDVDLCLRVAESGLANLFTPYVSLYHFESKTRETHLASPAEAQRFLEEVQWMQLRWFNTLACDAYYSPNYSLELPGFKLSWPPRETVSGKPVLEARSLDRYVTHSNIQRASEVVRTMGSTPGSLGSIACPAEGRRAGLSVIILNLNKPEFILPLISSMTAAEEYFAANGLGFEILIGDTGSDDADVLKLYDSAPPFLTVRRGLKYQFSRCNNQVFAELSQYDTVLFLNNDMAFEEDAAQSLIQLREFLHANPDAGVVGAQLLFPDRTIQHVGIGVFEDGPLRGFVYHPNAHQNECPAEQFPRTVWAVTGACLMVRACDFNSVGGFDEGYETECQDAALCLELRRRGKASFVVSPGVIYHFENGTRDKGSEDWGDRQRFMRHWGSWIDMELGQLAP